MPRNKGVIDEAFFPHIVQLVFDSADYDALQVLARVSPAWRVAARRRLRPLEHATVRAAEVPAEVSQGRTAEYLYAVCGAGLGGERVRVLADAQHFHWGAAGDAWHDFEVAGGGRGLSPLPAGERGGPWEYEYYDADEEVYVCPKGDGRVDCFEEIAARDADALARARVLDAAYPLDRAEVFLTARLMPALHTVRFTPPPPGDAAEPLLAHPRARTVVYFDSPGRWLQPALHADALWDGEYALCSDATRKLVVHQAPARGRTPAPAEAMFPPAPARPAQLQRITYVFRPRDAGEPGGECGDGADGADGTHGSDAANGADGAGARQDPLALFVELAVWVAAHGIAVTAVGAGDVDPRLVAAGAAGGAGAAGSAADGGGAVAVEQALRRRIAACAARVAAERPPGVPGVPGVPGALADGSRAQAHPVAFVTRAQYRVAVGQEEFDAETDVD